MIAGEETVLATINSGWINATSLQKVAALIYYFRDKIRAHDEIFKSQNSVSVEDNADLAQFDKEFAGQRAKYESNLNTCKNVYDKILSVIAAQNEESIFRANDALTNLFSDLTIGEGGSSSVRISPADTMSELEVEDAWNMYCAAVKKADASAQAAAAGAAVKKADASAQAAAAGAAGAPAAAQPAAATGGHRGGAGDDSIEALIQSFKTCHTNLIQKIETAKAVATASKTEEEAAAAAAPADATKAAAAAAAAARLGEFSSLGSIKNFDSDINKINTSGTKGDVLTKLHTHRKDLIELTRKVYAVIGMETKEYPDASNVALIGMYPNRQSLAVLQDEDKTLLERFEDIGRELGTNVEKKPLGAATGTGEYQVLGTYVLNTDLTTHYLDFIATANQKRAALNAFTASDPPQVKALNDLKETLDNYDTRIRYVKDRLENSPEKLLGLSLELSKQPKVLDVNGDTLLTADGKEVLRSPATESSFSYPRFYFLSKNADLQWKSLVLLKRSMEEFREILRAHFTLDTWLNRISYIKQTFDTTYTNVWNANTNSYEANTEASWIGKRMGYTNSKGYRKEKSWLRRGVAVHRDRWVYV